MDKTTLYLDPGDYRRLKRLAANQCRGAVAEYVARHELPLPKSIGAYSSGLKDLAERDEDYLDGMGELQPQRKLRGRR